MNSRTNATDAARIVFAAEKAKSAIKPGSLTDYRRAIAKLPRPSSEQIDNFVHYYSDAHSWYKHMPLLPPGVNFQFYVDPFIGCETVLKTVGGRLHEERTETEKTRNYQKKYGHLAASPRGVGLDTGSKVTKPANLPVVGTTDGYCRIPRELIEVGTVELTGVLHSLVFQVWTWKIFLPRLIANGVDEAARKWPVETGGEGTFRKIVEVCDRYTQEELLDQDANHGQWGRPNSDLEALLRPERQRMQSEMTEAISRMLELVYGNENSETN